MTNQEIEETIQLIRNSEELGEGSCSTYDECYSDNELREEIIGAVIFMKPDATPFHVFDKFVEREKGYWENQREISGAYDEEPISPEELVAIAKEDAEHRAEQNSKCGGCGKKGSYYDGLCFQCQCEYHSVGAYNMDGGGW